MSISNEFVNDFIPNVKANSNYDRFWYRFRHNKKQYRGIIDISSRGISLRDRKMVAKREFIELKEKIEKGIDAEATVDEMVQKYFETLSEGQYKRDCESFYKTYIKDKIGNREIASIIPDDIQKIVNAVIKLGRSPKTAKQTISILSPAFRIARANRIMFHNPCEDVHIKMNKVKKMVSNASERLKNVYDVVMSMYADDPYYRAFFLLAIQGRRRGEIFDLIAEDVILDQDYYIIRDTKNEEDQKHYLPPKVKEALMQFMPKKGLVFASKITGDRRNTVQRQVKKIRDKTGDWFTLHYTRNLIVSAMSEKGVDSIHLSGALGHNDPNTITKYLSLNYTIGSRMASDMIDDISAEIVEAE